MGIVILGQHPLLAFQPLSRKAGTERHLRRCSFVDNGFGQLLEVPHEVFHARQGYDASVKLRSAACEWVTRNVPNFEAWLRQPATGASSAASCFPAGCAAPLIAKLLSLLGANMSAK